MLILLLTLVLLLLLLQFLISPDGTPYKRYSPRLDFTGMIEDIKFLCKVDLSNEKQL